MDLYDIVADYEKTFVGKRCIVYTAYKQLSSFEVAFETTDLFHLLGLHKLVKGSATRNIEKIKDKQLSLYTLKNHHRYPEVKPRVLHYGYIKEIFVDDKQANCIVEKDIRPNRMRLSVIFPKSLGKKVVVLGLRRDKNNVFRLTTLHEALNKRYSGHRRTKITGIEWI